MLNNNSSILSPSSVQILSAVIVVNGLLSLNNQHLSIGNVSESKKIPMKFLLAACPDGIISTPILFHITLTCSLDIVVRNDMVERAKAGDKCTFTGCLIVIPDITQLALPGSRIESRNEAGGRSKNGAGDGVSGLKALGVRELTYKLSFLSCMVQSTQSQVFTLIYLPYLFFK